MLVPVAYNELLESYHRESAVRQAAFTGKNIYGEFDYNAFFESEKPYLKVAKEKLKAIKGGMAAERAVGRQERSEDKSVQEGARGGRYYVSATGSKVYVKSNPGTEEVGQVSKMPFIGGLPATAYMQEPIKR
jgi:hypothetical protein